MDVSVMEARPPYVDFEKRAVEDRNESIAKGCWVGRDVDYVVITPIGSKDRIEREAKEWLDKITVDAQDGRMPLQWVEGYKSMYRQWQQGQEIPLDGTPIVGWGLVSPAQAKHLLSLNVRTVEDLSRANDETKQRIGMGSEALKQKAVAWLRTAESTGKVSAESAALKAQLNDAGAQILALQEKLLAVTAEVEALRTAKK